MILACGACGGILEPVLPWLIPIGAAILCFLRGCKLWGHKKDDCECECHKENEDAQTG